MALHAHLSKQLLYAVIPVSFGQIPPMVFKRKSHVLADSERIVESRMLKQKAHLFPDRAHAVEIQSCNVVSINTDRSGVRRCEPDDQPQQHALAGATASQHSQGFAAPHRQADPIQNSLTVECLAQFLYRDYRSIRALFRFLHARLDLSEAGRGHIKFSPCFKTCSLEDHENEFHQYNISQNHEEGCQHN